MANQEPFSFNRDRNIGEKTPHAGDIPVEQGGERPVREFDNTPLPVAVEQGLVRTPEDTDHPALRDVKIAPEQKPWHQKRAVQIGGAVAGLIAAGSAVVGLNGGDKVSSEPRQETTVSAPADQTEEEVPTTSPESESSTGIEPISVERYPSLDQQIAKGFEIVTEAVNDPGPNISGPVYKYDEVLFGSNHYDTDMKDTHDWLGELSRNIGYLNDDFSILNANQPKFVDEFKFVKIIEQENDSTAIVELLETTNAPDFDPEYRKKIPDYLGSTFDLSGQETTYWEVSMRYENGHALFSKMITLPDYEPATE